MINIVKHDHIVKTQRIATEVAKFYASKTPFKIFHGSTNSTRILAFKENEMLDASDLNQILSIDTKRLVAVVEPNVPMDKLVTATLRYGLVPPVIPEFPGITVGGGIQGGAGESSSFKWGFLSQTVNWTEYVLGDGSIVTASPKEHSDLFYGAAGSCGSLGVITATEIQLIPAKKYVHLTYYPVDSFDAAVRALNEESQKKNDFVDGILFGKDHGVIITGMFTDKKRGKVQKFSHAYNPWYYLHTARIDATHAVYRETVPVKDYLFRYNRGAFWVGRYAFELFGVPFNSFMRFMLNPILNTRKLYQALQVSGASQEYVVQDLTVPFDNSVAFLNYIHNTTAIYPLWLCPVKPELRSPLLCNGIDTHLAINIGVWGPRITDYTKFKKINRDLEAALARYNGKKWMYAHTYYTKGEFWNIYDKTWYDRLRRQYKATTLPDMYDKVVVNKLYKIDTRRGLLRTILGKARLRIEKESS